MPTLELIAEIQFLKTQLAQCQERLAVAEKALKQITKEWGEGHRRAEYRAIDLLSSKLVNQVRDALDHAPSDWVAVRREDLIWAIKMVEEMCDYCEKPHGTYKSWPEYHRLKKLSGGKP